MSNILFKIEISTKHSPIFQIEDFNDGCYDYIEVRDGGDAEAELIDFFCGDKKPDDIVSTGNQLYVKFVSDGSVQKAGFAASFMKGKKLESVINIKVL